MKRWIWLSLIILAMGLAACGPSGQSAAEAPAEAEAAVDASEAEAEPTATAEEAPTEAAESATNDEAETTEESSPAEAEAEATTEEPAEESQAAASSSDEHAATCDDPFADVGDVRFSPDVWSASRMGAFVGEDILDPQSGLETNFCKHSVPYDEIMSGGPPPDGIPPIDGPSFVSLAEGDEWLSAGQPVIALEIDDEARAYPLAILTRHEIVNDELGGIPVAVTFCPLCNTGVVYDRRVDGELLRFGVSGNLRNSDLVMWDNKTLSWWQQFTGEAIVGDMTGTVLEVVPAQMVAWTDFKAEFPEGEVLSTEGRNYGVNPYAGYDFSSRPFLFQDEPDPRVPALQRVLGYATEEAAIAYPMPTVEEAGVIEDTIAGQDVVIFFEPGQVSALDESVIEQSKEVGSAAMSIPEVDGQTLTFSYNDGVITDNETGSEWNIFGRAVSGELEGSQLEQLQARVDFWFAWAAFQPETEVYEG